MYALHVNLRALRLSLTIREAKREKSADFTTTERYHELQGAKLAVQPSPHFSLGHGENATALYALHKCTSARGLRIPVCADGQQNVVVD